MTESNGLALEVETGTTGSIPQGIRDKVESTTFAGLRREPASVGGSPAKSYFLR
jgi:hypothetical protein